MKHKHAPDAAVAVSANALDELLAAAKAAGKHAGETERLRLTAAIAAVTDPAAPADPPAPAQEA